MRGLTIDQMLQLSWGWQGPRRRQEEGREHYEIRIEELPDFFLAAETAEELMRELKPALRAYLASYIDRGEEPALPPQEEWRFSLPTRPEVKGQSGERLTLEAVA